jgi:hypothetical protein
MKVIYIAQVIECLLIDFRVKFSTEQILVTYLSGHCHKNSCSRCWSDEDKTVQGRMLRMFRSSHFTIFKEIAQGELFQY